MSTSGRLWSLRTQVAHRLVIGLDDSSEDAVRILLDKIVPWRLGLGYLECPNSSGQMSRQAGKYTLNSSFRNPLAAMCRHDFPASNAKLQSVRARDVSRTAAVLALSPLPITIISSGMLCFSSASCEAASSAISYWNAFE